MTRWKQRAVVKALFGELLEILDMSGRNVRPEFKDHFAGTGVKDGNFAHKFFGLELFAAGGRDDGRGFDVIQVRKIFFQVGVAFRLGCGPGPAASARAPSPYSLLILSTTSIPSVTLPKGEKPMPSSRVLLPKLMNNCVVRVLGPAVAKVIVPRVLLPLTGSSVMFASRHFAETSGSP